ncbi:MAG: glycosyltransferase [Alphaproteobacteria bacterium]|nr:glycosyltransferase [Alphaproteobacteria bacterium]
MTPRKFKFALDRGRLPTFAIEAGPDETVSVLQAATSLQSGDGVSALAALEGSSRPTLFAALVRAMSLFVAGRFLEAAAAADQLMATPLSRPILVLLKAMALERADRPWLSLDVLRDHLKHRLGLTDADEASILRAIAAASDTILRDPLFPAIGQALWRLHAFDTDDPTLLAALDETSATLAVKRPAQLDSIINALLFMGLGETSQPAWQDAVFTRAVVPLLRRLIDVGLGNIAVRLEPKIYRRYVSTRETATHFRTCYEILGPMFGSAGVASRATVSTPLMDSVRRDRYRIAFIAPALPDLANIQVAIDIAVAIQSLPDRRMDIVLVGIKGIDPAVQRRCGAIGIPFLTSAALVAPTYANLGLPEKVATYLRMENFDAVVWLSSPPYCAYAFALQLAPVQIYFSMKYHGFIPPKTDALLCGGSVGQKHRVIEGHRWRVATTAYKDLHDPALAEHAAKIRATMGPDRVILGCLGREEKICNPPYLATIAAILREHPSAIFLWTGRTAPEAVTSAFRDAGVADQAKFIGWVNTKLYANVLDLFLDSFPFPCGVTALQAMAAGVPVVLFDSPESRETGVPALTQPILEGEVDDPVLVRELVDILMPDSEKTNWPFAKSTGQFQQMAGELTCSHERRQTVGAAHRRFAESFVMRTDLCGKTYQDHIVDVIESKAAGKSGH